MRFTDSTDLFQVLKYSSQRMTRMMTVPIITGYKKLRRVLNPNGFTTKVMGDVRKGAKDLVTGKPKSLKDYYSIGNYYVAKKIVFFIAILMLILPIFYLKFVHPAIKSNFLTTMVVNSVDMIGYTGKVKLLSTKGGSVLYSGKLDNGRINGDGFVYDYNGQLIYQGAFSQEKYEGKGKSYHPNGKVQYIGSFSDNLYQDSGTLYDEAGVLLYEGNFDKGLYEGAGKLYEEGNLRYQGDFKAGLYHGEGKLFENGNLLYEGQFQNGKMEGIGKLYSGDTVTYEGTFADGLFEGSGKEYDASTGKLLYDGEYAKGQCEGEGKLFDVNTGDLVYEGGFYQGVFSGTGKQYVAATGTVRYVGGFRAGRYDGEGALYDKDWGAAVYQGGFLLGVYHGTGTEYNPANGFVLAAGEFRNGKLVIPGETPEEPPFLPGEDGTDPGILPDIPAIPGIPGTEGGETEGEPTTPESPTDAEEYVTNTGVYVGPVTENGGISYSALIKLPVAQIQAKFKVDPVSWNLSGSNVYIYTDKTTGLGLAVRGDGSGKTVSLDIFNDTALQGGKVGMTRTQLEAAYGQPKAATTEAIGIERMVSISQSNRYFGRLTNLSPESKVTVATYEVGGNQIRAVYSGKQNQCLLLEIIP